MERMTNNVIDDVKLNPEIVDLDAFIRKAGGSACIAAFIGRNQYTVDRWTQTGVPVEHWSKLRSRYGLAISTIYRISECARKDYRLKCKQQEKRIRLRKSKKNQTIDPRENQTNENQTNENKKNI